MNPKKYFALLMPAALLLLAFIVKPMAKKITLYMIGDSTMSIKEKKYYPETGWGMPFAHFWDSTVLVDNRAQNGRSTKSFMAEKRWESVMSTLAEGDYVFIQFGHNDEIPTKKSATTPDEFKANLEKYINDTRFKKAIPVLLTSVARRKFDSTGTLVDTHRQYADITRTVAREQNVILLDVDKSSRELLQQLGPQGSLFLFNHLQPGEHPNYPEGKEDDTHFNELGARKMAELVLAQLKIQLPELAERIYRPAPKK
ncbi:MAG: rhamnogalacturonan acetylesterase [Ferruginibacter sp.]